MITYQYLDEETREQLVELMDGDLHDIIDLIETLEEMNPACQEELRTAVIQGNAAGVQYAAHTLKGSYAQLGASQMAAIMKQLETAGRDKDLSQASALMQEFEAEELKVRRAFSSWKEILASGVLS